MKKLRILLLFLVSPLLLDSCLFLYKPYGIKALTELKSSNEADVLQDFATVLKCKYRNGIYNAVLEYNETTKNVEMISLQRIGIEKDPYTYLYIQNFLNCYYLITSDNLNELFNPDWVKTRYYSKKKTISFTKYKSQEAKENRSYEKYLYEYIDGYLLLLQYGKYFNGSIDNNDLRI